MDVAFGDAPSDLIWVNEKGFYYDKPYSGFQGRYAASSFLPRRDAGALGRLISDEFIISKPYLEFLVTGAQMAQISVELEVDGKIVKRLEPDNPTTHFERICWNVSQWLGRRGRIKVVDDSPTRPHAYVEVDDFYLTDIPSAIPQ